MKKLGMTITKTFMLLILNKDVEHDTHEDVDAVETHLRCLA